MVAVRFSTDSPVENPQEVIQRAEDFFKTNQDVPEARTSASRERSRKDSVLVDDSDFRSIRGKPQKN